MRHAWLLIPLALAACKREKPAPAPPSPAPASAAPELGGAPKPNYPTKVDEPDARALQLCRLLHEYPRERKKECCPSVAPGLSLEPLCTPALTSALAKGALKIDEAAVARCEQALRTTLAPCDWVGPDSGPLPDECLDLVVGLRAAGAACGSTLECAAGLVCHGVAPTGPGVCGAPRPAGGGCGGADALASFLRAGAVEDRRPWCEGVCVMHKCRDATAEGAACKGHVECGRGRLCVEGACKTASLPGANAACLTGRCDKGLRCVNERCVHPKAEGEACAADAECRASCVIAEGQSKGTCGKNCDYYRGIREELKKAAEKSRRAHDAVKAPPPKR